MGKLNQRSDIVGAIKLFFAWSAFVFIPFNIIAGVIIKDASSLTDLIFGLILGTSVLLILSIAPIIYASKHSSTYSEGIDYTVKSPWLKNGLKLMIPFVNICWFILQTAIVVEAFTDNNQGTFTTGLYYFFTAFLFISGSYFLGYRWLYSFGIISIISLSTFIGITISTNHPSIELTAFVDGVGFLGVASMIVGTWIFSSTTIVMDVAKNVTDWKLSVTAVISATVLANISLILIGIFYATSEGVTYITEPKMGVSYLFLLLVVAIWSTNDSNFYSTAKTLENMGLDRKITFALVLTATTCIGTAYGSGLYPLIGKWLQILGWLGLPIGAFWIFQVGKRR